MKRFAIYDTNPLATTERQHRMRGEMVFLCGRAEPKRLGEIEAKNAADAVLAARDQWPQMAVAQLWAKEAIGA